MVDLVEWLLEQIAEEEAIVGDGSSDGGPVLRWDNSGLLTDPARVLAECAAKRAIIEEYRKRDDDVDLMLGPDSRRQREWSGLYLAVRLLAAIYADRDGYQPEWAPDA